jgi:antitoxin VapB
VRLPKEFRFQGTEVVVRRDPVTGEVVLSEPRAQSSGESWQERFAAWDALERDQNPPIEREAFHAERLTPDSGQTRKLTLRELYAIFDQADFPEDFFKREVSMPRELDLF